jgi:hypothetical protein|tara:strand:- start:569 stop:1600 length:1032 start_codon:yes stop_codon:yes gene_type:complete
MINIREFGIPAGAGSNFVAKNILWGVTTNIDARNDKNVFITDRRIDLMNSGCFGGFDTTYSTRSVFMAFLAGRDDIVQVLYRYDELLNKLDFFGAAVRDAEKNNRTHKDSSVYRKRLIKHFEDFDFDITMFYLLPHCSLQFPFDLVELTHINNYLREEAIVKEIISLRDIIVSMFEDIYLFYIDLHRKNCANSYSISHDLVEVYLFKNKKLKIPERKTAAFKFDNATVALCAILDGTKNDRQWQVDSLQRTYFPENETPNPINWTEWYNRSIEYADVVIDYRKVFAENDAKEIERMYQFFNLSELYIENQKNINKSFKDYSDKNMKVVTECVPELKQFDDMFS